MAEAVPIRFYYGTRSGFDALSAASQIGQPYFISDLGAIIVAHSTDAPDTGNLNFLLIALPPSGHVCSRRRWRVFPGSRCPARTGHWRRTSRDRRKASR